LKLGVISDTHLNRYDEHFEKTITQYLKDADLIIHAGDVVSLAVLDMFGKSKLTVVCGNMDPISLHKKYPDKLVMEINGFRIAVIHDINKIRGWGMSANLGDKINRFFGRIDCLIHGHTHDPAISKTDGIILFNPGSATNNRYLPFNTLGIVEIKDRIEVDVLEIA